MNPNIYAYELLQRMFNCNKTPLSQSGCKVVAQDPPAISRVWDTKGTEGSHAGPTPENYRCHKLHTPKTRSEKIAKTIKLFLHEEKLPENNMSDKILDASLQLNNSLESLEVNQFTAA